MEETQVEDQDTQNEILVSQKLLIGVTTGEPIHLHTRVL